MSIDEAIKSAEEWLKSAEDDLEWRPAMNALKMAEGYMKLAELKFKVGQ